MHISELTLLTADLAGTRHFYEEILGFPRLLRGEELASFAAGSSILNFSQTQEERPVYHFAFNIPNNQYEPALQWATKKQIELIPITPGNFIADFKSWNAKAFYFFDNNGNIVEMIARFSLDNAVEGRFNGTTIHSISEIGLVVNEPMACAQQLISELDLQFFSRQPPANDFIAMGDDEGLFIVVSENRNWYPTAIRSTRYWGKVVFASGGKDHEMIL